MLPIGVLCTVEAGHARMHAQVIAPDGERMVTADVDAPVSFDPVRLGERIATELIKSGALELLPDPVL
jgi:porphobilinogen deaminase